MCGEKGMRKFLRHLIRDKSGQDLVEYALLLALLVLVVALALPGLGSAISNAFQNGADSSVAEKWPCCD